MILLGEKKGVIGSNVFSWMLAELQASASLERVSPTLGPCGNRIQHSQQQVMTWSRTHQ